MLAWRGFATAATVALALLFVACTADEDGESPIRLGYSPTIQPGQPGQPPPTQSAGRTATAMPSPGAATPEPFAAICGFGGETAARHDDDGRLLSPPPPPPPAPVASVAKREDAQLLLTIRRSLGEREDRFGVVVVNLADGRYAGLNGERSFNAASLYKLTVLYEVFRQREAGLLEFSEALLYTPYYERFDLGVASMPVCSSVTVDEATESMITVSENVSAVLLQDRVGAGAINQDMAALGLTATGLAPEGVTTTPRDMAFLLELIARHRAVSEGASRQMLDLLLRQTVRNRIPAGLPANVPVGNKTGDWVDATHDVAIVLAPFGVYVIAVLSEQPDAEPIAMLSTAVYNYFDTGQVPPAPVPGRPPAPSPTASPGARTGS